MNLLEQQHLLQQQQYIQPSANIDYQTVPLIANAEGTEASVKAQQLPNTTVEMPVLYGADITLDGGIWLGILSCAEPQFTKPKLPRLHIQAQETPSQQQKSQTLRIKRQLRDAAQQKQQADYVNRIASHMQQQQRQVPGSGQLPATVCNQTSPPLISPLHKTLPKRQKDQLKRPLTTNTDSLDVAVRTDSSPTTATASTGQLLTVINSAPSSHKIPKLYNLTSDLIGIAAWPQQAGAIKKKNIAGALRASSASTLLADSAKVKEKQRLIAQTVVPTGPISSSSSLQDSASKLMANNSNGPDCTDLLAALNSFTQQLGDIAQSLVEARFRSFMGNVKKRLVDASRRLVVPRRSNRVPNHRLKSAQ